MFKSPRSQVPCVTSGVWYPGLIRIGPGKQRVDSGMERWIHTLRRDSLCSVVLLGTNVIIN
eukprot:2629411-Pyramimonas_sp.AAC.2